MSRTYFRGGQCIPDIFFGHNFYNFMTHHVTYLNGRFDTSILDPNRVGEREDPADRIDQPVAPGPVEHNPAHAGAEKDPDPGHRGEPEIRTSWRREKISQTSPRRSPAWMAVLAPAVWREGEPLLPNAVKRNCRRIVMTLCIPRMGGL